MQPDFYFRSILTWLKFKSDFYYHYKCRLYISCGHLNKIWILVASETLYTLQSIYAFLVSIIYLFDILLIALRKGVAKGLNIETIKRFSAIAIENWKSINNVRNQNILVICWKIRPLEHFWPITVCNMWTVESSIMPKSNHSQAGEGQWYFVKTNPMPGVLYFLETSLQSLFTNHNQKKKKILSHYHYQFSRNP